MPMTIRPSGKAYKIAQVILGLPKKKTRLNDSESRSHSFLTPTRESRIKKRLSWENRSLL